MKIFSKLYAMMMRWAAHRHATYYLGVVSFAESSFFPLPPDIMLAPMSLAQPDRAWYLATLTTITSVLGGLAAYVIGYFAFETVAEPLIFAMGYEEKFAHIMQLIKEWLDKWGFWGILIIGLSPMPYKLFTLASGALNIALLPFIIVSIIDRASRFYVVAGLMRWGGARFEKQLMRYMDYIGWGSVALVVVGVVLYYLLAK